jgi:hypothetical protein
MGPSDSPSAGSPRVLEFVVSCLVGLATVLGEVADLPIIVAWVAGWCRLLWWPNYHLLLRSSRGLVVLLLLLWLVLLVAALELLWRLV